MDNPSPQEVLVVEDEAFVRMVAADALADGGIMAWEAGSAHEALAVLEEHPRIGLVFTDVDMPGGMNGLDLAYHITTERPEVELIITSGAVAISDDQLPAGGVFLPKPYQPSKLVDLANSKLDK